MLFLRGNIALHPDITSSFEVLEEDPSFEEQVQLAGGVSGLQALADLLLEFTDLGLGVEHELDDRRTAVVDLVAH